MNIALVPLYFFPIRGGIETAVYNLAKIFLEKGHEVSILSSLYQPSLPHFELIDEIPVYRLDFRSPFAILKLFKFIKKNRPEIIHIHYLGIHIFYLMWLRNIFKFKIIITTHGFPFHISILSNLPKSFNRFFLGFALKNSDKIIVNTSKELDAILQIMPSVVDKTSIVANGINLNEFESKDKYTHSRHYIFSLLRFRQEKGFDVLIMAFEIVAKEYPSIDLIISGWGEQLEYAKKMITHLKLENRIFIFENIDRIKQIKLFNGCEFFVLPSRIESFGIVNLEAMAAGKAIVASKVGGIPEVVRDGINGILVEPKDDKALAQGMIRLLEDKELRQKFGDNGRKIVQEYCWDRIAERYLQVYSESTT